MNDDELIRKNLRFGGIFVIVSIIMIGLTFASVPFYRLFCQVTGFDGTPTIDPNGHASHIIDRQIIVRFNADVIQGMPWSFHPESEPVTMKIGQKALVSFYARNESDHPITGTAIYNIVPEEAGQYFHKTQCFCFSSQTLEPHADAHMPVQFFVDPKLNDDPDLKDLKTITLSYTFFPAQSQELDKALDKFYQN